MRKHFGTDGVRGTVGQSPMTPEFVLRLGYAAGRILAKKGLHPAVCIGKDTRISGYMIESALEAGFSAAGVDVHMCGPIPTAAVAYLARALRLSAGIVISASHNPYADNGIKLFAAGGRKLTDDLEAAVEAALDAGMDSRPAADDVGRPAGIADIEGERVDVVSQGEYIEAGADAVLAASVFHFGEFSILEAKQALRDRGLPVRIPRP